MRMAVIDDLPRIIIRLAASQDLEVDVAVCRPPFQFLLLSDLFISAQPEEKGDER